MIHSDEKSLREALANLSAMNRCKPLPYPATMTLGSLSLAVNELLELRTKNAAQARLLELAETLAGAAGIASIEPTTTRLADLRDANTAFRAAQAEYQSTGKVPCPECEAKDRDIRDWTESCNDASRRLDAEKAKRLTEVHLLGEAATENAELRRQLAEARADVHWWMMQCAEADNERDQAQADNAALVEALSKYGEHTGGDSETGKGDKTSCGCGLWNILSQPHPGAGLLEELAALRKVAEALTGHDHGHLSRWVTTLKQSDGEGWAIAEMVQRYLDAIRNRKYDQ